MSFQDANCSSFVSLMNSSCSLLRSMKGFCETCNCYRRLYHRRRILQPSRLMAFTFGDIGKVSARVGEGKNGRTNIWSIYALENWCWGRFDLGWDFYYFFFVFSQFIIRLQRIDSGEMYMPGKPDKVHQVSILSSLLGKKKKNVFSFFILLLFFWLMLLIQMKGKCCLHIWLFVKMLQMMFLPKRRLRGPSKNRILIR